MCSICKVRNTGCLRNMNVNTVFLMSRKKNYIYFDYDEDTKICHLGHAFTVEKNSNIAGSGIFIFETPIGKYLYSSKIFMFQIFSWKCTQSLLHCRCFNYSKGPGHHGRG